MPVSRGRQSAVSGHGTVVDSWRDCGDGGRVWVTGADSHWSARRRRVIIVRHSIHRTTLTLASIISVLVVGVSDGFHHSSTSDADTVRHTMTGRSVADADDNLVSTGISDMRHGQLKASDVSSNYDRKRVSSENKHSVSFSLLVGASQLVFYCSVFSATEADRII